MSRFSVAKDKVLDDLEGIVAELLRANRKYMRSGLWNVANPYRPKSKPEQMVVWLKGARRGGWKDFVSGETGDAIDLVAYGLSGIVSADSRMVAVAWVEDRYGLKTMDPKMRAQMTAEGQARRVAAEAKDIERRETSIGRARKFFFSCSDILGTPADLYLQGRNVDLSTLPHIGRSLRFRADCEYWMIDGKPKHPAMVSAMVDVTGRIGACHYTFLQRDGATWSKLDVKRPKLMYPETGGLAIRLTNGASGLSAEEAALQGIAGPCGIVEGIEDGLTGGAAYPDLRMWSVGSLGGFASLPDHAAISSYIIFKDNDWGKRQAQKQFAKGVAHIKSFGKPVEVVSMPADWGKDVNDAIRSGW